MNTAPLDPDRATRRALADAALALIDTLYAAHDAAPIFAPTDAAVLAAMAAPPPEAAQPLADVMARLQAAAAGGWSKRHGGDLSFIPSGGLYSGSVAAGLAAALHAYTGAAHEAPALVALEESVLRWLVGLLGLPAASEGLLLSGGSLANQTAMVCAREEAGFADGRALVYLSERAHHSLPKALHLVGVAASRLRFIEADDEERIDVAALRAQIAEDRAAGGRTGLVIGVAGGTDCGSVDDLRALADVAAETGAWFHVDAAYGGLFALTERGRMRLAGIDRADSVTVDLHKGLLLPYGAGALLVRRPGALARSHGGSGDYLRDVPAQPDLPHYFERGPEMTRPFRGLLAWLPLQLHGVAAFRDTLDRMLDLAGHAAARLRAMPTIEVLQAPALSIVVFRARAGDGATQGLLERLNAGGRFHVSSTRLAGGLAIRLALLHPRTTAARVDDLLAAIAAAAA